MLILHDATYYESRKPEVDLGACKNCLRFIWNKEKKAFLDRTAKEWATVGLFYFCFFGVLFLMFALQMWITVYHISHLDKPYFQLSKPISNNRRAVRSIVFQQPSLNFESPGIGFQPNIFSSRTSPTIWIDASKTQSGFRRYIESLNDTFQEYLKDESNYSPDCIKGQVRNYTSTDSCFFDIKVLGVCGLPPYGYTVPFQPCVIIKFNKRFNWIPDCFNQTSVLPQDMPEWLKKVIRSSTKKYSKHFMTQSYVWLSCDGVNNVDKEFVGQIDYFPISGFPAQYFPFNGRRDYLAPLVALRFTNLTVNRLVTVECKIWAENIKHKRPYNLDFQLMFNTL